MFEKLLLLVIELLIVAPILLLVDHWLDDEKIIEQFLLAPTVQRKATLLAIR